VRTAVWLIATDALRMIEERQKVTGPDHSPNRYTMGWK
jgi:hypothetical protein